MTKYEAFAEACRLWFTPGTTAEDVVAYASRGRLSPLYRVGANRRSGATVARGVSDTSWEDAFHNALHCQDHAPTTIATREAE